MMRPPTHHLRELAALVACAHLAVVLLELGGRAVYPGEPLLGLMADHPAWLWLHLGVAAAIVLTVMVRRLEWVALFWGGLVMGGWAGLLFAWRVGASPGVPLLGPTFGLGFAALAFILSHYWTEPDNH